MASTCGRWHARSTVWKATSLDCGAICPRSSAMRCATFAARTATNFERTVRRLTKKFIHEGKYAAEVPVDLIEDDTAWSPYLSPDDASKLDTVRLALRRGGVGEAAKHGRVFDLTPVAAK